jgi:hypothetical protein
MKALTADWKRELLGFSLTVMETVWVAVWFLAVIYPYSPRHPALNLALGVFAALLLISWLVRILEKAEVAPNVISATIAVLALVSGLAFVRAHLYPGGGVLDFSWTLQLARNLARIGEFVPPDLVLLLLVFFLWWRGMSLGTREHRFDRVSFSFRAGIVLLMWNAALSALLGWRIPILGFAFVYFFFGLFAVGLSRIYDLELQPESGGRVSTPFWLGSTLGGIVAVLLVALLATQLITVGNLQIVARLLNPLWRALEVVGLFLAQLVALIIGPLLDWLVRFFQSRIDPQLLETSPVPEATPDPLLQLPASPPAYLDWLKYAFIAVIILGALALVAFSIRKARARTIQRGRAEEREIDWQWSPPGKGLGGALRAGLDKLSDLLNLAGQFGLGQRFRAAASIRWIYANMLHWAAELGYARQKWQTPYEFLGALRLAFPALDVEMHAITEAYVRSHYGEVPDSEAEIQKIRSHWERIQELEQTESAER